MYTWTYDTPSGVYKNHEMSMKLWEQAVADSVLMEFAQPISDFGKGMGESVTLTRLKAMEEPENAVLTEGIRIPEDEFEMSTRQITVKEFGRAVPYTSLANDLSEFDITNPIQRKLIEQMTLTFDTRASQAFKKTKLKLNTTGAETYTLSTNGAFSGASSTGLKIHHIGLIRDTMYADYFINPYADGDYMGVFHTQSIRSLKDDSDWETWHKYTDPAAKYNGEVGRIESVRFMETNHQRALGRVGNNSVLGEGFIFGQDSIAMAEVMTPELRAAPPTDFGRAQAVAWYGILDFDIIWETANAGEVKIIHVGST